MSDGQHALPLASAQDHKRVFDGDKGPNTGGMGAYSPAPCVTPAIADEVMARIIHPTLDGMAKDGHPYKGVLYAGLMLTAKGPQLIEYNVRFGDPECQVLLPRLKSDLLPALLAARDGVLKDFDLRWHDEAALCVVLAAKGYPDDPQRGSEIRGLDAAAASDPNGADFPRRHQARGRQAPRRWRARAQYRGPRGDDRGGAQPRLCRDRPHRLARRLLPPRYRLARA